MSAKLLMTTNIATYHNNDIILSQPTSKLVTIDLLGGHNIWDAGDFFSIYFDDNVSDYLNCVLNSEIDVAVNNTETQNKILQVFQSMTNHPNIMGINPKWVTSRWIVDFVLAYGEQYIYVMVKNINGSTYYHEY